MRKRPQGLPRYSREDPLSSEQRFSYSQQQRVKNTTSRGFQSTTSRRKRKKRVSFKVTKRFFERCILSCAFLSFPAVLYFIFFAAGSSNSNGNLRANQALAEAHFRYSNKTSASIARNYDTELPQSRLSKKKQPLSFPSLVEETYKGKKISCLDRGFLIRSNAVDNKEKSLQSARTINSEKSIDNRNSLALQEDHTCCDEETNTFLPNGWFQCSKNVRIPCWQVNDDYCDCPSSLADEFLTSACSFSPLNLLIYTTSGGESQTHGSGEEAIFALPPSKENHRGPLTLVCKANPKIHPPSKKSMDGMGNFLGGLWNSLSKAEDISLGPSRINDGVCDCCDGADEPLQLEPCPYNCH
eukprot:g414.t1